MLDILSLYYAMLPSFNEVPEPFDTAWCKILIGGFVGICLGSFITMLSYRVPRRLSLMTSDSYCPSCRHPLGWIDLVPVLSWLCTRGRCRYCDAAIATRYIVIEIVTGLLSAVAFLWFGYSSVQLQAQLSITVIMTITVMVIERKKS